jgi:hypothetical protein
MCESCEKAVGERKEAVDCEFLGSCDWLDNEKEGENEGRAELQVWKLSVFGNLVRHDCQPQESFKMTSRAKLVRDGRRCYHTTADDIPLLS